jgi:ubiquinone/menaquinone biosynthesis C-methylase UbiE/uncharacterized protein YbaR (Trm112 family)
LVSPRLLAIVRCPACREEGLLQPEGEALRCTHCGEVYPRRPGYLDLMPRQEAFSHTSGYVAQEEAFAAAWDYHTAGPPLLAAGVRQHVLRRMLRLQPPDRILDCGCGNGKFALWNRDAVGLMVGLDPATLFADAALEHVELVQGDARRLPFAAASFDKAFSIDVFEHLTRPDLEAVLAELHRLLRPRGRLLIYSNTREPSRLQGVVDLWRRLGRWLRRRGLAAPDHDALRKADHVKAIATFEELAALVQSQGFRTVQVRFWNSVFTSFVEQVLVPALTPSPHRTAPGGGEEVRAGLRERAARRGPLYWAARALTWWMGLDIALFGRLRSGSYFLLLERL